MVRKIYDVITIDCLKIKLKIDNNFIKTPKNTDSLDCFFDLDGDSESFEEFSLNKYPSDNFSLGDFKLKNDKKYYRKRGSL